MAVDGFQAHLLADGPVNPKSVIADVIPVDLRTLMTSEPPTEEWCIEPILPAGKLVGFVASRGDGKSLLILDVAARRAVGLPTLLHSAADPIHVVYFDFEMGPDDLYDRLAEFGWLPDHPEFSVLCEHLHYYQLPDLPPLDTEAGGGAIEEIVDRHDASLVVIDSLSRVISGKENDAEPFLALFRHTETRLKRRGVTVARLDHLGKDKDKGSRGSSAKEDVLDVVWKMTYKTPEVVLTKTKGRQSWIPPEARISRQTIDGRLVHTMEPSFAPQWVIDKAFALDGRGVPSDAGVNATQKALQDLGLGTQRSKIRQIVTFRKGGSRISEPTGTTPPELQPELPEPFAGKTDPTRGNTTGTTPGTTRNQSKGGGFPL